MDPTAGLRILLAHDLSAASGEAAAWIAGTAWPGSTVVRIVTSPAGIGPPLSSFANLAEIRVQARELRETIADAHDRLAEALRRGGVAVQSRIAHGRPEHAILAEAERFGADLIVVGARGQGSIAARFLGSVSRAVVEASPHPVLVARGSGVHRVLLATDGSVPAAVATDLVATWPAFAQARLLIVAVGDPPPRYAGGVLGTVAWRSAFRDTIAASAERAGDVVERAARDLGVADREVEVEIRLGDVATEVMAAARAWSADLVVLGSDRRSAWQRLFADSLPRKVLDGVECSVLVARPPSEASSSEDAR